MSFGRAVAWLGLGNLAGQLLALLALPFFARYATPAEFGVFTVFVGLSAALSVLAGLKYDVAIVQPASDTTARHLASLTLLLAVAVGTALMCAFAISSTLTSKWWISAHAWLLAALAATAVGGGCQRALAAFLNRQGRYAPLALLQFLSSGGTVVLQSWVLMEGVSPLSGLVWGFVAGQWITVLSCAGFTQGEFRAAILRPPGAKSLRAVAAEFSRFPKYVIPYGMSSTLRDRAVHWVVGVFCGAAAVGYFGMAQRIAGAPNTLAYSGISPVVYAYASRSDRERVGLQVARLMELLAVLIVSVMLFVVVEAGAILRSLLGDEWGDTASYLKWLALAYAALAATSWIDRIFDAYGAQRVAFRLDVAFTAIMVLGVAGASLRGQGVDAAMAFGLIYIAYEIFWTVMAFRTNGLGLHHLRRPSIAAAGAAAGFLVLWELLPRLHGDLAGIAGGATAAAMVIGLYLIFGGGSRAALIFRESMSL